jgi:transketolase
LTIIAGGPLVSQSLEAAETLAHDGIDVRVLNMASIKPLDDEAVVRAARETGAIVTAENHSIYGGLGGAVAEVVGERCPVPVRRIGIRDVLAESGHNMELLHKYHMDAAAIAEASRQVLAMKGDLSS